MSINNDCKFVKVATFFKSANKTSPFDSFVAQTSKSSVFWWNDSPQQVCGRLNIRRPHQAVGDPQSS